MKVLNLGCGNSIINSWVNVDISPLADNVKKMNFLNGLNFSNESFDVVYMSHVLEHIPIEDVLNVSSEIYRVLRPGGILRIVVPNLEAIAQEYLQELQLERDSGEVSWRRSWLTLELLDQMTRRNSGGLMKVWYEEVASQSKEISDFVSWRVGQRIKTRVDRQLFPKTTFALPWLASKSLKKSKKRGWFLKEKLRKGEKHLWMWDELSLKELSDLTGFSKFTRYSATTSQLSDFFREIDQDALGNPRKGTSSIYVEFRK